MFCISISHKTAPAEVRQKFAFTIEERTRFIENIKNKICGLVVLATCNRMEIYFTGNDKTFADMESLLAKDRGVSTQIIRKYSMNYSDLQSVQHLCRVACGMDSMVLGEVEIIRQVKDAYKTSKELGCADGEINLAFQGALAAAKAFASNSNITRLPVSIGTLSAQEAVRFCGATGGGTTGTGPLAQNFGISGHVLVVGATGKIGSIVVKDIADIAPKVEIIGTSRTHNSSEDIFSRHANVKLADYSDRYSLLSWADVIISATASPHYTFVGDSTAAVVSENPKNRLFLDLAMPRDIDPSIEDIQGCTLKNIDYIRALSRENNENKEKALAKMAPWLSEKAGEIMKNIAISGFIQEHGDVAETLKGTDGLSLIYRLKNRLDYELFAKVLEVIGEATEEPREPRGQVPWFPQ